MDAPQDDAIVLDETLLVVTVHEAVQGQLAEPGAHAGNEHGDCHRAAFGASFH
ncbi:MAG TPA: hypothetical protein VGR63_13035 [Casimicrobiaceae bacterium]|jgi:hypothetical protein|nr:hypothetical protein [Casimicrobiaceae bacterium]